MAGRSIVTKRLTFVRRAPTVPAEEFAVRWRDATLARFDALAPSRRPRRVVHCVVRPGATRPSWDGVELAWFAATDDATGAASWTHAPELGDTPLDGSAVSVDVEERTVSGGDWLEDRWRLGGALGSVLIGLIEAADGLGREAFRDYWWDRHRPLADGLVPDEVAPVAYVHDYVLDESAADSGFTWAGIGEMYERSLSTARRRGEWFDTEAARPLALDEERFMVRSTRQVLVCDGEVLVHQPTD